MTELVSLEIDDPVALITLCRPDKLNAFTHPMLDALADAVAEAVASRRVVGIIITGQGRGFCAGLDASALTEATAAGSGGRPAVEADRLPGLFSYLIEQPKPIIAAVNGVAAGGGVVLAAKCDLRFASTEASFVSAFTARGLVAEHGTSWLLPRQIGTAAAFDVLWSSRRVAADEALAMGLVQRIWPADELIAGARSYVEHLAAEVSPAALADTKRMVYAHAGQPMADAFADADRITYAGLDRPDAIEGAASFVERRPPRFERLGDGT